MGLCAVCVESVGAGMVGEECLPPSCRSSRFVNFARAGARAVAPASPILLADRCAVVVVEAGTDNTYAYVQW